MTSRKGVKEQEVKRGLVFGSQCTHDTVDFLDQEVAMHAVMEMQWALTNNEERLYFKSYMLSRQGVKEKEGKGG